MLEALGNSVECPVCFEVMVGTIRQCVNGHSICGVCANTVVRCPLCTSNLTSSRNYQLEHVIENLQKLDTAPSSNDAAKGAKRKIAKGKVEEPQVSSEDQKRVCISNKFGFRADEEGIMDLRTRIQIYKWVPIKIDLSSNFFDTQFVSYKKDQELGVVLYNHRIDVRKKEAYWLLQYTEPKVNDGDYFYDFKMRQGSMQTIAIRETCYSDASNASTLIDLKKCIVVPFSTIYKYLSDDQEILIKFDIGKVQQDMDNASNHLHDVAYGNNSKDYVWLPNINIQHPSRYMFNGGNIPPLTSKTSASQVNGLRQLHPASRGINANTMGSPRVYGKQLQQAAPFHPYTVAVSNTATVSKNHSIHHLSANTNKNSNTFIGPNMPSPLGNLIGSGFDTSKNGDTSLEQLENQHKFLATIREERIYEMQMVEFSIQRNAPLPVNMALRRHQNMQCNTSILSENIGGNYNASLLNLPCLRSYNGSEIPSTVCNPNGLAAGNAKISKNCLFNNQQIVAAAVQYNTQNRSNGGENHNFPQKSIEYLVVPPPPSQEDATRDVQYSTQNRSNGGENYNFPQKSMEYLVVPPPPPRNTHGHPLSVPYNHPQNNFSAGNSQCLFSAGISVSTQTGASVNTNVRALHHQSSLQEENKTYPTQEY